VNVRQHRIDSKKHSLNRDQLDRAGVFLVQYRGVAVQQQPFVLDGELESSFDDLRVNLDSDTLLRASSSAFELELGKKRKPSVGTDAEGLLSEVERDDELQELAVSGLSPEASTRVVNYPDREGAKVENHFVCHHLVPLISPFPAFHYSTVDFHSELLGFQD
jgi:hypothetical protein